MRKYQIQFNGYKYKIQGQHGWMIFKRWHDYGKTVTSSQFKITYCDTLDEAKDELQKIIEREREDNSPWQTEFLTNGENQE